MNIAVATSCYNYGKYIPEWTDAILASKIKPNQVCFHDNGSTDDTWRLWLAAKARIESAGIRVADSRSADKADYGTARNCAVSLTDTEWVMHLDVDDKIMPHALNDWRQLCKSADVISMGYETFPSKPSRTNLYNTFTGRQNLWSPKLASAVSPFRRWLWEKSPYRTDLAGSWDTALWIGFCHLGARFVAMSRAGYWYRQHGDSLFTARPPMEKQRIGLNLMALRRQEKPMVSIVVPTSFGGCPYREAAWRFVKARMAKLYDWWEIVEVDGCDGTFSKARMANQGVSRAKGSIVVVMDADVVIDDQALLDSVDAVLHGAKWAIPHRDVWRLTEADSAYFMEHGKTVQFPEFDRKPYAGVEGGGAFVMTRANYAAIGGMDERFEGWGGEDLAFGWCARSFFGAPHRAATPLIHLWHPSQPTKHGAFGNNEALGRQYKEAANSRLLMAYLLSQRHDVEGIAMNHFLCIDVDYYAMHYRKYPFAPDIIRVGGKHDPSRNRGVLRLPNVKGLRLDKLPSFYRISEAEYNSILARSAKTV